MTWWENVQQVTGGATLGSIARRVGLSEAAIQRWKAGTPKPENVVLFCRAYGIPVVDGFVYAGWLTKDDALITPSERPNPSDLSDDELISEVSRRIRRGALALVGDDDLATAELHSPDVSYSDRLTKREQARRRTSSGGSPES